MGEPRVVLCRAQKRDHDAITGLIETAAEWLRTKNIDQWAQPWPSEEDRSHRIIQDLIAGKTWIARQGDLPVATITADSGESAAWDSGQSAALFHIPPAAGI